MSQDRIQLTDTTIDMIVKLSEGNPGAATALAELVKNASRIDPESALGPFGPMMALDNLRIYGSGIHILFVDICNRSPRTMIMLLRAVQMGFMGVRELVNVTREETRGLGLSLERIAELDKLVCAELVEFEKNPLHPAMVSG